MQASWNDKRGHRGRSAWCLLITARGDIHVFAGKKIAGVVAVRGDDYEKNGKWSSTTYRLELADGVRMITGYTGWETGRFVEGLRSAVGGPPIDTWGDLANALGVTVGEARRFLGEWRPKAAEAIDAAEEAIAEIDDAMSSGANVVTISFGSPTRRLREAGFWGWPVVATADGREVGRLVCDDAGCWNASGEVALVAHEHANGHGGGYVSLRVAVPDGAVLEHRPDTVPAADTDIGSNIDTEPGPLRAGLFDIANHRRSR